MHAAEIAITRPDPDTGPHPDEVVWRAQLLRADVAALSDLAGELQSLVQQTMALLGAVGASRRSAVWALAARLQSMSVVLAGVARLPDGLVHGAPTPLISGQIEAAIAALGGSVGPTGIVLAYPGEDPALSQELARLESALAAILARLRALLARLGAA